LRSALMPSETEVLGSNLGLARYGGGGSSLSNIDEDWHKCYEGCKMKIIIFLHILKILFSFTVHCAQIVCVHCSILYFGFIYR